jgi:23S rRNA (adenine2503-C2)-methyltransferase
MGCAFCFTARQGLGRNLTLRELTSQIEGAEKIAPVTGIVFMGMGEPLKNFENVTELCRHLMGRKRAPFSRRKITLSTSGIVPAIEKLSEAAPVRLAVSLNASNDSVRSQIMPVNVKWKIDELLSAAEGHAARTRMPVMLEYVLIKGLNDALEDAERLKLKVQGRPFQVNLIPFNEFPESPFRRPPPEQMKRFQHLLVSQGITATIRYSGGNDILAACGQLTGKFNAPTETHARN